MEIVVGGSSLKGSSLKGSGWRERLGFEGNGFEGFVGGDEFAVVGGKDTSLKATSRIIAWLVLKLYYQIHSYVVQIPYAKGNQYLLSVFLFIRT